MRSSAFLLVSVLCSTAVGQSNAAIDRGYDHFRKGEFDAAIANYTEAVLLDPTNAIAYLNRGATWEKKGELDKAIRDFNEAIRLDPKDTIAYYNRGATWEKKGELDKAIADYNESIRHDPNSYAYRKLAWLMATCPIAKYRDGAKAVKFATKACELTEWQLGNYVDALAAAYAELGDFDKAIQYQERAIELAWDKVKEDYCSRLELYKSGKPYRFGPMK